MSRSEWGFCSRMFLFLVTFFLVSSAHGEFLEVTPGRKFNFPRDHGAHVEYPVEWWYFTGHLKAQSAEQVTVERTFGFELTFFRVGINPKEGARETPWHVGSLYLAHAALTDDSNQRFLFEKIRVRPDFGQAGASTERLEVWARDWRVEQGPKGESQSTIRLQVEARDAQTGEMFSFSFAVQPQKAPVLQGDAGYSQKGASPGDASYYVSFTRLEGDGEVVIGNEELRVGVEAWMDHEVLSSKPNSREVGWDWFAMQFQNDWECMLYNLRRGNPLVRTQYSSGSCVSPEGEKFLLTASDFLIQPSGSWRSERSGIEYPSGWTVSIPKMGIEARVAPTVKGQELLSGSGGERTYWEGRCLIEGSMDGEPQRGAAYVELVGYTR